MIPVEHLTARRGATFGPHGWPLLDADGHPLRSAVGIRVQAQVRPSPNSTEVLHSWDSQGEGANVILGTMVLPGDTEPTAVALLHATAEETATWDWRRCPYDVLVTALGRTDQVKRGDFIVERGTTR